MNVMNYLDYNRISNVRQSVLTEKSSESAVLKKAEEQIKKVAPGKLEDFSTERDDSRVLPTDKVIDFALKSDMKTDVTSVGKGESLESLDVTKAISDMHKDGLMKEYRMFVQNARADRFSSEDGIVVKKRINS